MTAEYLHGYWTCEVLKQEFEGVNFFCSQVVTHKKNEEAPKGALSVGMDEGFGEKKSRRVSS